MKTETKTLVLAGLEELHDYLAELTEEHTPDRAEQVRHEARAAVAQLSPRERSHNRRLLEAKALARKRDAAAIDERTWTELTGELVKLRDYIHSAWRDTHASNRRRCYVLRARPRAKRRASVRRVGSRRGSCGSASGGGRGDPDEPEPPGERPPHRAEAVAS